MSRLWRWLRVLGLGLRRGFGGGRGIELRYPIRSEGRHGATHRVGLLIVGCRPLALTEHGEADPRTGLVVQVYADVLAGREVHRYTPSESTPVMPVSSV
jgi:hypothetical protein